MDSSYLTSQVSTIIDQLHGLFDEIGVPSHERESRESELFAALSEALHNQVRIVAAEKNELTEEANQIITTIKQMEISLDDEKEGEKYDEDELKVTYPLSRCLQQLKEKHRQISRMHRERVEQVIKLVQALESYSSHLEPSFIKLTLPPTADNASIPPTFDLSPSYVEALDNEFTRVYEEYVRRLATVKALAENIIQLWAELGTPQAQTDGAIVKHYRDSPEQLGLHESDIARLRSKRDKLNEEKKMRERRLKELKTMVESLWDRLGVEEGDRKQFLNSNRGCGVRQINEFEDELARLNELKRQNLHLFVEDVRYKLQALWDQLYFSEDEMLEFTPAFSDVYSDALLSAHEKEVERLEALREQRAPVLALIDKHRSLIKDQNDLASSSQDASRLMMRGQKGEKRDPTRLLREEKMRKRITKELPKVSAELRAILENYEEEYGRPFKVHGEGYLDELDASEAKAAPSRSKTPGLASQSVRGKTAPPPSRSNSVRGPPPSRPKTPAPIDTGRRNGFANSVRETKTPTKIPGSRPVSRPPLSYLQHGGNSPERRARPETFHESRIRHEPQYDSGAVRIRPMSLYDNGTIKSRMQERMQDRRPPFGDSGNMNSRSIDSATSMAPPVRAPPPRMKDLFEPPPPTPGSRVFRSGSVMSSESGSVHNVPPEDVYDDRPDQQQRPWKDLHSSMRLNSNDVLSRLSSTSTVITNHSNGSTAPTAISGSENWETYDDQSEPEQDAREAYYAKLRGNRNKRLTPENEYPQTATIKKIKGIPPVTSAVQSMVDENGQRIVSKTDSNWTDDHDGL